uniref:Lysosomal acid phosphatase n=1 Tax=Sinocyclocheilus grahami TaxID=75366 RepID=A0A672SQD7_SINGR
MKIIYLLNVCQLHYIVCNIIIHKQKWLIFPLCIPTLKFQSSPIKAYPTDPYKESDWPQGFGQLSQEGMKQHFELGQFLKKRYTGFLSEDYDRHEIFIRSTDVDRTLMSAEVNLAGMFPPNGSEVFNPDMKWQPIPVHTVPADEEKLLSFPLDDCPRYTQLMNETEKTDIFLNMTETYKVSPPCKNSFITAEHMS